MADEDDLSTADHGTSDPVPGTEAPDPGSTDTPPVSVDEFISPQELPAEVVPHFKRMQAAYTRKMQALAADRDKVELVTRFRSDPEFARQLIAAEAQRMGLTLQAPPPANGQPAPNGTPGAPPPELVARIEASLSPELKWMAPQMAAATWASTQMYIQPLAQRSQQADQEARTQQYEALVAQLSEALPGWEAHEEDMAEVHRWLKSDAMTHPRFGSKLELLYHAVTRNAAAVRTATQRMTDAARSASRTGQSNRTSLPNITDRVRKAASTREAWDIAIKHAQEEAHRQGLA